MPGLFEQAAREGWASSYGSLPVAEMGGVKVDTLVPRVATAGRRNSLSSRYGEGVFPAHVDGAHWRVPPRFVVLHCQSCTNGQPTLLYNWRQVELVLTARQRLEREVFVFASGRRSLLDTIVDRARRFVRYDPSCMQGATRGAADLLRQIGDAVMCAGGELVEWEPGLTVVVDNWQVLHSRGLARRPGERVLLRAFVNEWSAEAP